jgi:cysteine desulfurase
MTRLDRAGIAVSAGSACHAGSLKPSKVLTAMGYSAAESFRALRLSLGFGNTDEHIDRVLELLPKFAREVADW